MKLRIVIFNCFLIALFLSTNINTDAQMIDKSIILLETPYGNMKIKLYDETPMHKENFLKLVSEKFFDDQIFHRVIEDFMIQAGDPNSKNAPPGKPLGFGDLGYTIPAEFNKNLYHKKGALAAARQPDNVNPSKESSASQFYIVQGKVYPNHILDMMEQRNKHIKFTDEQRNIYSTIGGTPHLDYAYTVFGEVIEGIDVIDKIAAVETDSRDRPLKDIKIKISLVE
jgi:cyclophilin family peptidyl-prolyl cis-trans isomerase